MENDFDSMTVSEKEMFAKAIRSLLDGKRIMKEKKEDKKMWEFVSSPVNEKRISEYLKMSDFKLVMDRATNVCFITPANTYDGLTARNRVTFKNSEYAVLLVLWQKYIDNCGFSEEICVTRKEIAEEVEKFPVSFRQNGITPSLATLKAYDFIDYDEKDKGEDAPIRIYPSVQFGIDWDAFLSIAEEYLSSIKEDIKNAEDNEEADSINIVPACAPCMYDGTYEI